MIVMFMIVSLAWAAQSHRAKVLSKLFILYCYRWADRSTAGRFNHRTAQRTIKSTPARNMPQKKRTDKMSQASQPLSQQPEQAVQQTMTEGIVRRIISMYSMDDKNQEVVNSIYAEGHRHGRTRDGDRSISQSHGH